MYVEFLGLPRERAGIGEMEIDAETFGDVLDALATQVPGLRELITAGHLHPALAANLNCDAFVSDRSTPIGKNDRLLILSADAGG